MLSITLGWVRTNSDLVFAVGCPVVYPVVSCGVSCGVLWFSDIPSREGTGPLAVRLSLSLARPAGSCRLKNPVDDPSLCNLCSFSLKLFNDEAETMSSLNVFHLLKVL